MPRDYSQILSGGQGQRQIRQQQQNQPRSRGRQQNQNLDVQGSRTDMITNTATSSKKVRQSLANTLGTSAESARNLGIPKKVAHRIVDQAYRGNF